MKNYNEALEKLNGRERRKLKNNTYLERIDTETIGVRLHNTFVVTYKANGDIILKTGGWHTVTTKDRINAYSPVGISQKNFTWYVSRYDGNGIHAPLGEFEEGMVFNQGHKVTV